MGSAKMEDITHGLPPLGFLQLFRDFIDLVAHYWLRCLKEIIRGM